MLADPDQRLREHLRIDNFVREHCGRMYTGSVSALLDVDGTTVQGNCFDLPELGTSNVAELLASRTTRRDSGTASPLRGAGEFIKLNSLSTGQGYIGTVIAPDGGHILTASKDGTARVWEAFSDPQALVDRVKAEVPRCLTPEQPNASSSRPSRGRSGR
jgi:hypothetical protein